MVTVTELITSSCEMPRFITRTCFSRLHAAIMVRMSTTNVVVFTPPAVEPGLPPTNISRLVSRYAPSEK